MSSNFQLLGKRRRLWVRGIARQSLEESGGDEKRAMALAERRIRAAPKSIIGTILIGVAIKLAFELVMYWIKNRTATVPSGEFLTGEPGA